MNIITEFVNYCESRIILGLESSRFSFDRSDELADEIQAFEGFQLLLSEPSDVLVRVHDSAETSSTWEAEFLKWQILLSIIEEILVRRRAEDSGRAREDEEEEAEAEEEDEDDDEGLGADRAAHRARMMVITLRDRFSYAPQIIAYLLSLDSWITGGVFAKTGSMIQSRMISAWRRFKSFLRAAAKLIGLDQVFMGLDRAMKRNVVARFATKFIGTFPFVAVALFVVARPIYRFSQNPVKIFKWLIRELDIEIPGGEQE